MNSSGPLEKPGTNQPKRGRHGQVPVSDKGDVIARNIEKQTGGRWIVWYGRATGRFWATPRPPFSWYGLREGAAPVELLAAIGEVGAYYGGSPRRPEGMWRWR